MAKISVGQQAPDFELFNDEMKSFKLSESHGSKNVLLLFYPGAFTGVCTNELNMVTNDIEEYGAQTLIAGVSTDSPFVLSEFKKVHGFAFQLLSDHNAEISSVYGSKYDNDFTDMNLDRIAKRSAFVINKEGVVVYEEVLENAGELPNLDAIKEVLSGL